MLRRFLLFTLGLSLPFGILLLLQRIRTSELWRVTCDVLMALWEKMEVVDGQRGVGKYKLLCILEFYVGKMFNSKSTRHICVISL